MPTNTNFLPIVKLKTGERCTLKNHFHGALRELVGYLESRAKKNDQRFVWAKVKNLPQKNVLKEFRSKQHYSLTQLEKSLELLRDMGVVTARLQERDKRGWLRGGLQGATTR